VKTKRGREKGKEWEDDHGFKENQKNIAAKVQSSFASSLVPLDLHPSPLEHRTKVVALMQDAELMKGGEFVFFVFKDRLHLTIAAGRPKRTSARETGRGTDKSEPPCAFNFLCLLASLHAVLSTSDSLAANKSLNVVRIPTSGSLDPKTRGPSQFENCFVLIFFCAALSPAFCFGRILSVGTL